LINVKSTKPEELSFCLMYKVQGLKNWFFAQRTKYKVRQIGFLLNVQSTKSAKLVFCPMSKVQSRKW